MLIFKQKFKSFCEKNGQATIGCGTGRGQEKDRSIRAGCFRMHSLPENLP